MRVLLLLSVLGVMTGLGVGADGVEEPVAVAAPEDSPSVARAPRSWWGRSPVQEYYTPPGYWGRGASAPDYYDFNFHYGRAAPAYDDFDFRNGRNLPPPPVYYDYDEYTPPPPDDYAPFTHQYGRAPPDYLEHYQLPPSAYYRSFPPPPPPTFPDYEFDFDSDDYTPQRSGRCGKFNLRFGRRR